MRNKTITLSPDTPEGKAYLEKCRRITEPVTAVEEVLDSAIRGDAFSVLPLLPKESVDLLIADPPYNRRKVYGETAHRRMAEEEYARWTKQWISLALPLLKPTGTIYFCCDWQTSMIVGPILTEMTHVRNRITWQREKGRGARTNWKNAMEDIWFATLSDTYTFHRDAVRLRRRVRAPYRENGIPKDWKETPDGAFRDTCPSNFWDDITVPFWSMAENTSHPTQKPEKLMARLILASTDPGGVVLDPFFGAGSALTAAKKLGRHYIGIEKEAQYCCFAAKRLADADTDRRIQGYEDGVFWERNAGR